MSGLICLATMRLLIPTLALLALAADPTPPDVDSIVVDDFESYTDENGHRIFQTWIDSWCAEGPPPGLPCGGTGATVGHADPPFAEQHILHGGKQSMPVYYDNRSTPNYSDTYRQWRTPQDWTAQGMNTLSLWFRGETTNSDESFYVALQDKGGWIGIVTHPDPNALRTTEWREWQIRLTMFSFGPVDVTAVTHMYIGVGDRQNPKPGGTGTVYIDDIRLLRCAPLPEPNEPDFLVIDDFESYTDVPGQIIWNAWADDRLREPEPGCPNGCVGGTVGHAEPPYAEQQIVHGGKQSMPLAYNNVPRCSMLYSEASYLWQTPQDWSHIGMNALSLWFRGEAGNSPEPFYVALEASGRQMAVVNHPDPKVLLIPEWTQWQIPLPDFTRNNLDLARIEQMYIGVGDRHHPKPGGTGTMYIDDIRLVRVVQPVGPADPGVVVLDDFESYTDEKGNWIWGTWLDGWSFCCGPGSGTNSTIGHITPPYAEQQIIHGGKQSMPVEYDNLATPNYSEVERRWARPQDWTAYEANAVSLWFRGEASNSPEPFYLALEDNKQHVWAVNHPDPKALLATEWQQWRIPLLTFVRNKVDIAAIQRMYIGVGDRKNPKPGGEGHFYIDDIQLIKFPAPEEPDYVMVQIIDDFESYTDDPLERIFLTWPDSWGCSMGGPYGYDDCTGAVLTGYKEPPFTEQTIVHAGRQSMPLSYDNSIPAECPPGPYTSETQRTWDTRQDWTTHGGDTLTLWVHGKAANDPRPFYVALHDIKGRYKAVTHPDSNVLLTTRWQVWHIPLATFTAAGVDPTAVKRMDIGIGGRENLKPGGAGMIYIDDIMLTKRTPTTGADGK
jgi:hypothetical protein